MFTRVSAEVNIGNRFTAKAARRSCNSTALIEISCSIRAMRTVHCSIPLPFIVQGNIREVYPIGMLPCGADLTGSFWTGLTERINLD